MTAPGPTQNQKGILMANATRSLVGRENRRATAAAEVLTGDLDEDVAYLIELGYQEFEDFVIHNLAPDAPKMAWDALTDYDVLNRTGDVIKGVTPRFRELSKDERLDEFQLRRARFMYRSLLERQREVKHFARQRQFEYEAKKANDRDTKKLADDQQQLSWTLAHAINRHRLACIAAGIASEPHDDALWSVLEDSVWPHRDDKEPVTLAALLTSRNDVPAEVES